MRESNYQRQIIKKLKVLFPGCIVLKNNPEHLQGVPDLILLYQDLWAALEVKESRTASSRPNQAYYVDVLNEMSFAAFIYPENEEEVLNELQHTFRSIRDSRVSQSE